MAQQENRQNEFGVLLWKSRNGFFFTGKVSGAKMREQLASMDGKFFQVCMNRYEDARKGRENDSPEFTLTIRPKCAPSNSQSSNGPGSGPKQENEDATRDDG